MANELEKFTQVMGSLDQQNAVKQIMEMFYQISRMSDEQLLILAQTIDFFEGRYLSPDAKYNCQKLKKAILNTVIRLNKSSIVINNSVRSQILDICR